MSSDIEFWENRDVRVDENGMITVILSWLESDEIAHVRELGFHSSRGIFHDREWWLKNYIKNNKDRTERHCRAGVREAKKILATEIN